MSWRGAQRVDPNKVVPIISHNDDDATVAPILLQETRSHEVRPPVLYPARRLTRLDLPSADLKVRQIKQARTLS